MTLPQAWLAEFGLSPLWISRGTQPDAVIPESPAETQPAKTQLTVSGSRATETTADAREIPAQARNGNVPATGRQEGGQSPGAQPPLGDATTRVETPDPTLRPISRPEPPRPARREEATFDRDARGGEAAGAPPRVVPVVAELEALRAEVAACTRCGLSKTRKQTVFGVGDPCADWMFIGEGPGSNEDRIGEPFVGQAGKLLDNMLNALGISRQKQVFIANVVKCRPPNNRDPLPDEIASCSGYLLRQVELVRPRVIVALGRFAAQTVLATDAGLGALRNRIHHYHGVPVIVTYHPAYLLRKPADKALVWQDLCAARAEFERMMAS